MSAAATTRSANVDRIPQPLRALIDRVVRATRLWPSEKRDVRAELESHFREGLIELRAAGLPEPECIEQLQQSFGEPALTATLIRRSKKRGRPMIWKCLIATGILLTTSLVTTAGYMAYVAFGSPSPSVDYVARLNEAAEQTPVEDRAWPLLREILVAFTPPAESHDKNLLTLHPGGDDWQRAADWIDANGALLPDIQSAIDKPHYGFVYDNDAMIAYMTRRAEHLGTDADAADWVLSPDPLVPPTIRIILPHLSDTRMLARFLVLHARQTRAAGDIAGAWRELNTAHRLGSHLMTGRTIIEQLVGVTIIYLALNDMNALLHDHSRLDRHTLDAMTDCHLMRTPADAIRGRLAGEQLMFMDVVQYLFTDDGDGNGHLIPSQFAKITGITSERTPLNSDDPALVAQAAMHADRKATVAMYQAVFRDMMDLIELPLHDPRRADAGAPIQALAQSDYQRVRYALIVQMLPNLAYADMAIRETTMRNETTIALFGLARYRADHGTWPDAPAADLQATWPTDVYSGKPLRYVWDDDGTLTVYSVGRNLTDDGGSTDIAPEIPNKHRKSPADIVFWPPPSSSPLY